MLNLLLKFGLFENDIYIDKFPVQISQASKMYQELDKDNKSFTLIHCWNILKEEDKWKAKRIELAELEKALRRGGGEACMEALDKMWAKKEAFDKEKEKAKQERFMASLELEKKRVSNEEKKAEADLIKQEKEIMSIDITSLNPLQRQYYETMQQKIVARHLAN